MLGLAHTQSKSNARDLRRGGLVALTGHHCCPGVVLWLSWCCPVVVLVLSCMPLGLHLRPVLSVSCGCPRVVLSPRLSYVLSVLPPLWSLNSPSTFIASSTAGQHLLSPPIVTIQPMRLLTDCTHMPSFTMHMKPAN